MKMIMMMMIIRLMIVMTPINTNLVYHTKQQQLLLSSPHLQQPIRSTAPTISKINNNSNNMTDIDNDNNIDNCFIPSNEESIASPIFQNILNTLYYTTSMLAFIGNSLVIIVQVYGHEIIATSIRRYLIQLAASDILFGLLSVPFTYTTAIYHRWSFVYWLCPVAQYIQLLTVFITATTLSIIGIER